MTFKIKNVEIIFNGFDNATIEMAKAALQYAEEHKQFEVAIISKITVTKQDNEATFDVEYLDEDQPKIGRIRRITGFKCPESITCFYK